MSGVNFRTSAKKGQQQNCVHHRQPFNYFCETCEEPICHLCTTLGPHNFNLHRCNKLQDAFTQRVFSIQEEIKTNLLQKRETMLAQIHRLEYRIEEIRYIAALVERDARAEMGGIQDRLKTEETNKQAILQHESQEIQKDLNEMNDLGIEFYDLTNHHTRDEIGFLLNNKFLHERIEFLIAKPTKKGVDVVANDLPQELTDLRLEMGKCNAQKRVLDMLNEIIWHYMNERKHDTETQQKLLEEQAKVEVTEWVKLVDHFTEQLKSQQMICFFCHASLEATSVNKKCIQNLNIPLQNINVPLEIRVGFTKEKPADQHVGNKRHFWGYPTQELKLRELLQSHQKKTPNAVVIETILSKLKRRAREYEIEQIQIEKEKQKQKEAQEKEKGKESGLSTSTAIVAEHKIDFKKILNEHDPQGKGTINHINFAFVLSELLHMTSEEIQNLISFLDDEQRGEIVITDLFTYMGSNQHVKQRAELLTNKYRTKKSTSKPK